jgi:hypothetical protein
MFIPAALAAVGSLATAGTATAAGASALSLAGTVGSTALGVGGALFQGISAMNMANYQAAVADNNRKMALQMQERAKIEGETAARDQDLKTKALIGQQRAQMGASGFDMNTGTPLDLQASSTALGRLDALRAKGGKDMEAWKYGVQAQQFANQGEMAEASGFNSMLSGFINAGSSLIGGAGSFATKWTQYDRLGYTKNWAG